MLKEIEETARKNLLIKANLWVMASNLSPYFEVVNILVQVSPEYLIFIIIIIIPFPRFNC